MSGSSLVPLLLTATWPRSMSSGAGGGPDGPGGPGGAAVLDRPSGDALANGQDPHGEPQVIDLDSS